MTESPSVRNYGPWQWALPENLKVPPDQIQARIDVYHESIVLRLWLDGVITTRPVSALDVARAFTRDIPVSTGILPEGALWWTSGSEGPMVALWRPPRVWPAALQLEAFKPPRRFSLPMPGLVFVCQPGRAPRVYAAKRRPRRPEDTLYLAPLFNLFRDGRTCAGTHSFPQEVTDIPESFFMAFFTREADIRGRSKKHPDNLLALWEELDGKKRFPLRDLVPWGKVEDLLGGGAG